MTNKYIGARYVPKIDGVWDIQKSYESLTVVTWEGNSYTSRTPVPQGISINNNTYWVQTGNYDAQVEIYRQDTLQYKTSVDSIGKMVTGTTPTNINSEILQYTSEGYPIIFPSKTIYTISSPIIIPSNAIIDFNNCEFRREIGSTPFDMVVNSQTGTGNVNIKIKNLLINGQCYSDNLDPWNNDSDRFCGLKFIKVSDSTIDNVYVTKTANAEDSVNIVRKGTAIYLSDCTRVKVKNCGGYNNNGTVVMFTDSNYCSGIDLITNNNSGSGVASRDGNAHTFINLLSYDNGYSNVTINTTNCIIDNVRVYNSGYGGLVLGHPTTGLEGDTAHPASNSVVTNVHAKDNKYSGIIIGESDNVKVSNCVCINNGLDASGTWDNIRVYGNSSNCTFNNVVSSGCTLRPAFNIKNGIGIKLVNCVATTSGWGIIYNSGTSGSIQNCTVSVNSHDGVQLLTSNCSIIDTEIFNNTLIGVLATVGNSTIKNVNVHDNGTNFSYGGDITTNVLDYNYNGGRYIDNGNCKVTKVKSSVADETGVAFFRVMTPVSCRVNIDFRVSVSYPSSSNALSGLASGLVTYCSTSGSVGATGTSALTQVTASNTTYTEGFTVALVEAPDKTYVDFTVTQNNEPNDFAMGVNVIATVETWTGTTKTLPNVTIL